VLALLAAACGRSGDETEEGASETTPAEEESGGGSGDFGDLTEVCSDGDARGATAQGVTDDSISVTTVSDPGFRGGMRISTWMWRRRSRDGDASAWPTSPRTRRCGPGC
jgi:hypothetical protein